MFLAKWDETALLFYHFTLFVLMELPHSVPQAADANAPSKPNKKRLFNPPPSFWDNLSQHVLSASTLREFDRRTTPRVHLVSSNADLIADDSLPLINRFCRQGGPSLAAIVGASINMVGQPI